MRKRIIIILTIVIMATLGCAKKQPTDPDWDNIFYEIELGGGHFEKIAKNLEMLDPGTYQNPDPEKYYEVCRVKMNEEYLAILETETHNVFITICEWSEDITKPIILYEEGDTFIPKPYKASYYKQRINEEVIDIIYPYDKKRVMWVQIYNLKTLLGMWAGKKKMRHSMKRVSLIFLLR